MNQYQSLSDEDLAALAAANNTAAAEALLLRYKNFVKKIVRPYFIMGADREDLIQEGMIGLHKAIGSYSCHHEKATSFASYAATCIKNQIMTAIKNAARKKHGPLNTYISIDNENPDIFYIIDNSHNPEKVLIYRESVQTFENAVNTTLSNLESTILRHFLAGLSYAEISEKLDITTKSVDNALFRIRRKIAKSIESS
ncbi:MAG: sigma-70 family RNA polymerase sigma factor [Defluviitaleaceae bacterium]|nr:sigma-70 family RNA polymerase sigma factor [Defluviitaleaceae bacterium]